LKRYSFRASEEDIETFDDIVDEAGACRSEALRALIRAVNDGEVTLDVLGGEDEREVEDGENRL
jgi:hypothetical protein